MDVAYLVHLKSSIPYLRKLLIVKRGTRLRSTRILEVMIQGEQEVLKSMVLHEIVIAKVVEGFLVSRSVRP